MRKIGGVLITILFLSGCLKATKKSITTGTSSQKAVKGELQEESSKKILTGIQGLTPNSIVALPRWRDPKTLAVYFLAYEISVEPVFGVAINLSYDPEILKYFSYEKGDFLEHGGKSIGNQKPVYLISDAGDKTTGGKPAKKNLIIGATLFRGTPGVAGSGKLFTLLFKARKQVPTRITFAKKKLKNLEARDINDINWPDSIAIPPYPRH